MNLKNKTVYILGGLGRIGQEVVQGLLDYSAKVVVIDRQSPKELSLSFKSNSDIKFIQVNSDEVEDAEHIFVKTVSNFDAG